MGTRVWVYRLTLLTSDRRAVHEGLSKLQARDLLQLFEDDRQVRYAVLEVGTRTLLVARLRCRHGVARWRVISAKRRTDGRRLPSYPPFTPEGFNLITGTNPTNLGREEVLAVSLSHLPKPTHRHGTNHPA